MKVLVQRSLQSHVSVDNKIVGNIDEGLTLFVGFGVGDTIENLQKMKDKIINFRVFSNNDGKFDYSLLDKKASVLLIPQFTLFADASHGRRPEFFSAMNPKDATKMFDIFSKMFEEEKGLLKAAKGVFGADMKVHVENDGPVSILLEN